jgi:hypothetical protein
VFQQCLTFATSADRARKALEHPRQRYDGAPDWTVNVPGPGATLLEDLRSLYLVAGAVAVTCVIAEQAGKALRDAELSEVACVCHTEAEAQVKWFLTRIKTGAPQALVVE